MRGRGAPARLSVMHRSAVWIGLDKRTPTAGGDDCQHGENKKSHRDEIHHSAQQRKPFEAIETDSSRVQLPAADLVHDFFTVPGQLPATERNQFVFQIMEILAPLAGRPDGLRFRRRRRRCFLVFLQSLSRNSRSR